MIAYADPRLLARVFDNVLSNAVHYNRDGGAVVISGSAEESAPDEWATGAIAHHRHRHRPRYSAERVGACLRSLLPRGPVARAPDRRQRPRARHLPRSDDRARRIDPHHQLLE